MKKVKLFLAVAFVAIQFFQPDKNKSSEVMQNDFEKVFTVPENIRSILQNDCYDCHSNSSRYPWYTNIQPISWIMASHIQNGKDQLNFSEFGSYTSRRQISKFKAISSQIKDDEMPLTSYKMMHKNARLSLTEKISLVDWIQIKVDSLAAVN